MAILGLDLGEKRIGVAVNLTEKFVQAKEIIEYNNFDEVIDDLKQTIINYQIEKIVVGLPRSFSGEENQQSKKIRKMANLIAVKLNKKIIFVNEILSTKIAAQNLSKKNQRNKLDSESAKIILETYLENKNQYNE